MSSLETFRLLVSNDARLLRTLFMHCMMLLRNFYFSSTMQRFCMTMNACSSYWCFVPVFVVRSSSASIRCASYFLPYEALGL